MKSLKTSYPFGKRVLKRWSLMITFEKHSSSLILSFLRLESWDPECLRLVTFLATSRVRSGAQISWPLSLRGLFPPHPVSNLAGELGQEDLQNITLFELMNLITGLQEAVWGWDSWTQWFVTLPIHMIHLGNFEKSQCPGDIPDQLNENTGGGT